MFACLNNQGEKAQVIQTLLFVAGVNTLLQALFGTRLPVVVGGSYAYVIPVLNIIFDSSLQQITDNHDVRSHSYVIPNNVCHWIVSNDSEGVLFYHTE